MHFFQAEDGIRDRSPSRGLGDVYKRQAPDSAMGDITGDLASRRGQVTGTANMAGGMMIISGTVPLSELDGYAARLNAITQGAGSYSMELAGYAPVPMQRQVELASNYHRKDEDE